MSNVLSGLGWKVGRDARGNSTGMLIAQTLPIILIGGWGDNVIEDFHGAFHRSKHRSPVYDIGSTRNNNSNRLPETSDSDWFMRATYSLNQL